MTELTAVAGEWYAASMGKTLPSGPLTYRDYCALPEDGNRYEILDGELFVSPAPRPKHQLVIGNLYTVLRPYVERRKLGTVFLSPTDLILALATRRKPDSRTTIAQPDLVFVATGRESIVTDRAIESPPDLAVEVVSPSTQMKDRNTKATLYARFGVPFYWILDPDNRLFEAWELRVGRYELATQARGSSVVAAPPFPKLRIALSRIWA